MLQGKPNFLKLINFKKQKKHVNSSAIGQTKSVPCYFLYNVSLLVSTKCNPLYNQEQVPEQTTNIASRSVFGPVKPLSSRR